MIANPDNETASIIQFNSGQNNGVSSSTMDHKNLTISNHGNSSDISEFSTNINNVIDDSIINSQSFIFTTCPNLNSKISSNLTQNNNDAAIFNNPLNNIVISNSTLSTLTSDTSGTLTLNFSSTVSDIVAKKNSQACIVLSSNCELNCKSLQNISSITLHKGAAINCDNDGSPYSIKAKYVSLTISEFDKRIKIVELICDSFINNKNPNITYADYEKNQSYCSGISSINKYNTSISNIDINVVEEYLAGYSNTLSLTGNEDS